MKGLRLEPTIAMRRNEEFIDQCAWCGALVAVPERTEKVKQLGVCPVCGGTKWWRQHLPVGPFERSQHPDTRGKLAGS